MSTFFHGWRRSAGCIFLLIVLDGPVVDARAGQTPKAKKVPSISGRVTIDGPIPEVPKLKLKVGLKLVIARNDEERRENERKIKEAKEIEVQDDSLVVGDEGAVANVVIYLKKAPPDWKPSDPPMDPFELRSDGDRFQPHVSVIPVGQTLRLISANDKPDNFSALPLRSNAFDILVPAGATRDVAPFAKSERLPVALQSHFRVGRNSWLLILDHPFAAVSDSEGRFEIHDLPPGEHHFTVWHERRGYMNKDLVVRVESDKVTTIDLKYKGEQFQPAKPTRANNGS